MSDWRIELKRTIGRLKTHAGLTGAAAFVLLVASTVIFDCGSAGRWLKLAMLVFSLIMLAQAAHLLFDTALFRLALAHDSEQAGLEAIDTTLFSMGLREMPVQPRLLAPRLAGTARILRRQYVLLAIGVTIFVLELFDRGAV